VTRSMALFMNMMSPQTVTSWYRTITSTGSGAAAVIRTGFGALNTTFPFREPLLQPRLVSSILQLLLQCGLQVLRARLPQNDPQLPS
jgi:hypothetical protein